MASGYQALTEKEKQALRLIVRGHDAKSTARQLGLSVHTINERLRDARRKLSVSSSREAARLVFETEGTTPETVGDKRLGEAAPRQAGHAASEEARVATSGLPASVLTGVAIMTLSLGIIAIASLYGGDVAPQTEASPPATAQAAPAESQNAEKLAASAARAWLELGDAGRWADGWAATGAHFRKVNTAAAWARVSEQVRAPLGAVRSRTLVSQENVPAPPNGVEVVKFPTDFANKAGALETLTMAREEGTWKVVGIYLE